MTILHKRVPALPAVSLRARSIPGNRRLILLTGCAVAIGLLLTPPAAAQFTCAESGTYPTTFSRVTVPDDGASASGTGAVACGTNANASAGNNTAVGASAAAGGAAGGASAFGSAALASANGSTAVGHKAVASGFGSTAVGGYYAPTNVAAALASGTWSTAVGIDSVASGFFATALGRNSKSTGQATLALGVTAQAAGTESIAMGYTAAAGGYIGGYNNPGAIAIGARSRAGASAVGQTNAVAIGVDAAADNTFASAFGNAAAASGVSSAALGTGAAAQGDNSVALGHNATAGGARSIAIGLNSSTGPDVIDAVALGGGASALGNKSVAIGRGSVADVGNVVSVGAVGAERRIIHVRRAVDPTDAVNLAQVQAMIAAAPAAGAPVTASVGAIDARGLRKQATATGSSVAAANPARNAGETGARKDRLASLGDGGAARTAQPVASLSCEIGGGKVSTAVDEQSSASSAFALVQQSGISFQQGGTAPGCVTLSFSAEVLAQGSSIMEVRAVLDGSVEASPGPVLFAQEVKLFNSRAFSFLFADVAPGPHRVEIQFRNAGEPGFVRVGQRTTMVQFAR